MRTITIFRLYAHFFDSLQMDILVLFVVLTQQVVVWTRMQSAEIPSASVSIVLRISMAHAKRVSLDAYSAKPKMFIECIDFSGSFLDVLYLNA